MLASLISKILTKRISNLLIEFTLIIFMFNLKKDCLFYWKKKQYKSRDKNNKSENELAQAKNKR